MARLPREPKQRFLSAVGEPPENVAELTFWIGSWLPLTPLAKYNLLKSGRVAERYQMINSVIQRARDISEQAQPFDWS